MFPFGVAAGTRQAAISTTRALDVSYADVCGSFAAGAANHSRNSTHRASSMVAGSHRVAAAVVEGANGSAPRFASDFPAMNRANVCLAGSALAASARRSASIVAAAACWSTPVAPSVSTATASVPQNDVGSRLIWPTLHTCDQYGPTGSAGLVVARQSITGTPNA